ncbi:ADP-ribosylglycohydrolase family protein [Lonsdalea quercina]|uniref:ADP-ribosylglycohydrolase family protein n=1 Tax=Lonsdalea quercina TaxID=71657 RepID=UPI003974A619
MSNKKENRIAGALYGQMLGDAMGMPSELWPRTRVKAHFGWIDRFLDGSKDNIVARYFKAGEYTDDTAMALALADALIECQGEVVPDAIAAHILAWADRVDAYSKVMLGPSSKIALAALKNGQAIRDLENNGVTNGSAMRISPLGCVVPAHSLDRFITEVELASSPTHKSDVAIAGATVIGWAVSQAVDGVRWEMLRDQLPAVARAAQEKRVTTYHASMAARIELALSIAKDSDGTESKMDRIYQLLGTTSDILDSVPAAIAMLELAGTQPNRCAVLCANLGGDTDTIGAMATAICGALHGVEAIDPQWRHQLDDVNHCNINTYARQLLTLRLQREKRKDV